MAGDDAGGRVVLFGGYPFGANGPDDATWEWNGVTWHRVVTASTPAARSKHALVYDSLRSVSVMFGGTGAGSLPTTDTWELAGNQWTRRFPASSPSSRERFGMTYDSGRSRVVLFGGWSGTSGVLGDTWEYDGSNWQLRSPATRPSARLGCQLAFDAARNESVMFGGEINGPFNDTWTWNGVDWLFKRPANMPPPGSAHRLVYDAARARVVGFGFDNDPFSWEWDGRNWQVVFATRPTSYNPILAYDAARRQVVGFGHLRQSYADHGDTWIYRTATPAEGIPYGTGCAGAAGAPQLAASPHALPWLGDSLTMRLQSLAPASTGALFVTGPTATPPTSLAAFGMPGCDGLVNAAATDFATVTNGNAAWSLAIPNTITLAGVRVFQQGFAIEPGANAAGIVASNGCELLVGIR